MATLHPFRALRPVPEKAEQIASVPYDVISAPEARRLAEGRPLSFLHVIRPEIDLPEGTDEHDDAVYLRGAENLRRLADGPFMLQEPEPAVYVYRLVMNGRPQTGIFACVSVDDYDTNVILKHEKTRQDKEDDRTRHLLTQQAHAEPVMLTYRDAPEVDALVRAAVLSAPLYDFTAPDGIRHTFWKAAEAAPFVQAFAGIDVLYVADGHHRCKAASRAAEKLRGGAAPAPGEAPEWAFFPAVLFPMSEMRIMPYNRLVRRLPMPPTAFLAALAAQCGPVAPAPDGTPVVKGEVRLYLEGEWVRLVLPETTRTGVADRLDVARLSEYVLEPLLGIMDIRTDRNIDFVGGIRGTAELERRVDSGECALGISMVETSITELMAVSDAGLLMPPKSTWFEPKLRSGLLVHLFD